MHQRNTPKNWLAMALTIGISVGLGSSIVLAQEPHAPNPLERTRVDLNVMEDNANQDMDKQLDPAPNPVESVEIEIKAGGVKRKSPKGFQASQK